ncbi:MAG: hypothetical protein ACT4O6_14340 [Reyranella sp.]
MWGRKHGDKAHTAIPAGQWDTLEIVDQRKVGAIAKPANHLAHPHENWGELVVRAFDVLRHWPLSRKRKTIDFNDWSYRLDSIAEVAWAARRRRDVSNSPMKQVELTSDGLPNALEVTLVEAWSWCAFGRALPPSVWQEEALLSSADEAYASARDHLAHCWWKYRHASTDKKMGLADDEEKSRNHQVATMMVGSALEGKKEALRKLALSVSAQKLIGATYEFARETQHIEPDDKDFEQRSSNISERKLFEAFQRGELECLGRKNLDVPQWEPLPKDYFRLPIELRINHNILETAKRGSVDDHKLIAAHVSTWSDLRVSVDRLRMWRRKDSGKSAIDDVAEPPARLTSLDHGLAFVNEGRLQALKSIVSARHDLSKLVRLCEELNSNWAARNYYSVAMIVRSIIDHVPPIFGAANFAGVESNYGSKSFKDSMRHLNSSSRAIADQHLHLQIRKRETLPNATQVNFSNDLDVLLGEIEVILRVP